MSYNQFILPRDKASSNSTLLKVRKRETIGPFFAYIILIKVEVTIPQIFNFFDFAKLLISLAIPRRISVS
jgi:hypothetical protein